VPPQVGRRSYRGQQDNGIRDGCLNAHVVGIHEPETFDEGMSPNFLERRGWTRTTLKIGDKITVTFHPLRKGANGGMFMTGKMDTGKVLTGSGSNN
jgi:hypothetical protein